MCVLSHLFTLWEQYQGDKVWPSLFMDVMLYSIRMNFLGDKSHSITLYGGCALLVLEQTFLGQMPGVALCVCIYEY